MNIAGHRITTRQLVALHALYQGLLKGTRVYGVNMFRQLESLADQGIIARSGAGVYLVPWDSPGARIIKATEGFSVGANL